MFSYRFVSDLGTQCSSSSSAGLTVGLLEHSVFEFPSSLHYRGGDCTWRISGLLGGITRTGPYLVLGALGAGVEITCEVNGIVLLQADIIDHGTLQLMIACVCASLLIFHWLT